MSDITLANTLADHLCKLATQMHIWRSKNDPRLNGVYLETRVGTGKKTYCQIPHDDRARITFGRNMVADKLTPGRAQLWLTGKEIRARNYFDGQLSLENTLTHTVLHEYAHLEQYLNGDLRAYSVHNAEFYAVLDAYYTQGLHLRIRDRLRVAADSELLSRDLYCQPVPRHVANPSAQLCDFSCGDYVDYDGRFGVFEAVVLRVNRKRITIERLLDGARFYAYPHSLRPI